VLADPKVRAILVNIFAGINRCDWVAQGVVNAVKELKPGVPLVVRLAGTNVEEGRKILKESGLELVTADTLTEAAEKVVAALRASGGAAATRAPGPGQAGGEQATGEVAGGNGKP
jgi:malate-CoA ligase subunit beta